jgi:hypothetical protein
MADQSSTKEIKIVTHRPEGQQREYANYIEFSINTRDVSLKFCDIKPHSTEEEYKESKEKNQIDVNVSREIVVPFDVVEEVVQKLSIYINKVKEDVKKGGSK